MLHRGSMRRARKRTRFDASHFTASSSVYVTVHGLPLSHVHVRAQPPVEPPAAKTSEAATRPKFVFPLADDQRSVFGRRIGVGVGLCHVLCTVIQQRFTSRAAPVATRTRLRGHGQQEAVRRRHCRCSAARIPAPSKVPARFQCRRRPGSRIPEARQAGRLGA